MSETAAILGDQLQIQVLGSFSIRAGDRVVLDGSWNRRKAMELVKLLAIQPQGSLPRERALDIVWPELPADAAGANLRKNLHYLRVALSAEGASPLVTIQGQTLVLASHALIDVRGFRAAAAEAIRQRTSIAAYDGALALYAGELLPEDLYQDWADAPRQQLARLHIRLLEQVSRLHALRGEHQLAIARLEQLLDIETTNEAAHRLLMQLYAVTGERERALHQYELCARELRRELTLQPSEETRRLRQQVIDGTLPPNWATGMIVSRPFVGREAEMIKARELVAATMRGQGKVLLLEGEAGIGKSRLAAEATAYADMEGVRALWGRCSEEEHAPAYWPWRQILRSFVETVGIDTTRAAAGPHAPALAQLLPELGSSLAANAGPALDPEQGRFRLFDGIAFLLRNAARQQPLVVVLDDVHEADAPSLSLLEFLSNDIETNRLFVICTYRPSEPTQNTRLSRTLSLLERRFRDCKVRLGGLSRDDVQRLVELTAELRPPEDLVSTIWGESEGNPFFVEEITRLLVAEGRLSMDDGEGDVLPIPESVRDLVVRRFAALSPATVQLLRTAAVVGREFRLDPLVRVSGESVEQCLGLLEEAESAHLLVELGFGHYTFSHALVRQALYLDLGQTRRTLLHHAVAQALESLHGANLQPHLAQLAHHYFAAIPAAEPERAVEFARRAADDATAQAAFEESARLLLLALRALHAAEHEPAPEIHCEIQLSLGRAQARAGDTPDARATFERAATIARDGSLSEAFARATLGYEDATFTEDWVPSEYEPAVLLLREAERVETLDHSLRTFVRARLARAIFFAGSDNEEAKGLARDAIAISARANTSAQIAALEALHWTLGPPEDHAERRAAAESMLALALASGDTTLAFKARAWLMVDLLECGDIETFDANLAAIHELADELRQPVYRWNAECFEATRANLSGRLEDAERLAGEALAFGQRARSAWALQAYGALVGAVRLQQGRLAELEPAIRALHEQYPEGMAWRSSLVFTQAYLGMLDEARAGFDSLAEQRFANLKRDGSWLITACVLAETAFILNDRDRAEVLYDLLRPFAALHAVAGNGWTFNGSVEHFLGLLATTMRESASAEAHFETAIAIHTKVGAVPFVARTKYALALDLLARGTSAAATRASLLLDEASTIAVDLRLPDLLEKIRTAQSRS